MKKYVQKGDSLTVSAPVGVASGQGVLVGDLFGVAANDALAAEPVVITVTGVFELAKAGDTIAVGELVYFDESEGTVTTTATDNHAIGHAVAVAGASAATVKVRLAA